MFCLKNNSFTSLFTLSTFFLQGTVVAHHVTMKGAITAMDRYFWKWKEVIWGNFISSCDPWNIVMETLQVLEDTFLGYSSQWILRASLRITSLGCTDSSHHHRHHHYRTLLINNHVNFNLSVLGIVIRQRQRNSLPSNFQRRGNEM